MNAITCVNTTMDDVIKNLPQWAELTSITGRQCVRNRRRLEFHADVDSAPGIREPAEPASRGAAGASDPGGISIWEAVEKQLGLKLRKGRGRCPYRRRSR